MGEGVNLCDMLLSMNRVPHWSTKYYMHIVFYCIGVCGKWVAPLSSSPTSEKSSTKEAHAPDQFSVSNSCKSLSGWKKTSTGAACSHGRRSSRFPTPVDVPIKKRKSSSVPNPVEDLTLDQCGPFPAYEEKQQHCLLCKTGYMDCKRLDGIAK